MPSNNNHNDNDIKITIDATTATYCYLDFDLANFRARLARTAAFVHATNHRYGLSSPHLHSLGGSERARIHDLYENDHEWKDGPTVVCEGRLQRVVIRLDWETTPITCTNFATLCHNRTKVGTAGKILSYKNSRIHRVVAGFCIQGG